MEIRGKPHGAAPLPQATQFKIMELIEVARTTSEKAFDLWSAGNTTELFLFMVNNCKVNEKPFKPMGYDSVFDLSAGYLIYDRDGMDEQLILVKRIW